MDGSTEYLREFYQLAGQQGLVQDVTFDDVTRARTREELGISSLNIILIVATYMKQHAYDGLTFRPEWVTMLEEVDGVVSVMREIAENSPAKAAVK